MDANSNSYIAEQIGQGYICFKDISYGAHPLQNMDIYVSQNKGGSKKKFTLIFIHGGGYFQSDKKNEERFIMPYFRVGYDIINLNYRLKKGMYTATEDVIKALHFINLNNSIYNLDLNNVILKGFSSGAHMASNIGLLVKKENLHFKMPKNIKVSAIINFSGPSHSLKEIESLFLNGESDYLKEIGHSFFPPHPTYSQQEIIRVLEPVNHIDESSPAFFLWIGGKDKEIPLFTHTRFIPILSRNKNNMIIFNENAGHIPSDGELEVAQKVIWRFIEKLDRQ